MGVLENFIDVLKEKQAQVQAILDKYKVVATPFREELAESMNYSFFIGGKRLRPLLMWETYHLFGGKDKIIEAFMAGMEWIHNHSLVHDDLPALDNDLLRRNQPTTHAKYGQAQAILTGDKMLNYSYEICLEAVMDSKDMHQGLVALHRLAQVSGQMLEGQVQDVLGEGKALTLEAIDWIYRNKTAALLQGSLEIGAILAGASREAVLDLSRIGLLIGIAYQIKDDILEVEADTTLLGKASTSDKNNKKSTYLGLVGLSESKQRIQEYLQEAKTLLERYVPKDSFMMALLLYLVEREY